MRKSVFTSAVVALALTTTLATTLPAQAAGHTRETTVRTPESVVRVVREFIKRLIGSPRATEKPVGPIPVAPTTTTTTAT